MHLSKPPASGSAVANGYPGSAPRLTRSRTGYRCAPVDLSSGVNSCHILAGVAGFFSELLGLQLSASVKDVAIDEDLAEVA